MREWIAAWLLLGVMATLWFVTYCNRVDRPPQIRGEPIFLYSPKMIEVSIEGAVVAPTTLTLEKGSTLADLLSKVALQADADIDDLPLDRVVRNRQRVVIPSARRICVEVFGDGVHAQRVFLKEEATVGALLKVVQLDPDAALWRLKKRQILADGDRIEIRRKK